MPNHKIILGLVGLPASGKTSFMKYCQDKYQAASFRFSDFLRDGLNSFGLEISRENLQKISTVMREGFDENLLARAMAKKSLGADSNLVVIDGVRRLTDIENLREIAGFYLIALPVTSKTRFSRNIARNENIGDQQMTFQEFLISEEAEADRQIPQVMKAADYAIENNGTLEEYFQKIDDLIKKIKNGNQD